VTVAPPDTLHAETFDVGKLGELIGWWVQRAPASILTYGYMTRQIRPDSCP
jgi:hypothetical protein